MKKYKLKCYSGNDPRILVTKEFVENNKLSHVRSVEEIKDRLKQKSDEMMNFEPEILIDYLPYESVRELLTDEAKKKYDKTPSKWKPITDIYETAQDFLDYLIFAYMKATDERSISASRSIQKLGCWLWLMGRDDLRRLVDDDELYNPYGSPALIKVSEEMGLPIPEYLREFASKKASY